MAVCDSICYCSCLLFFTINICSAANILMLSTVPSVSHSLWNQKLAKILADRNHHVTILDAGSPFFNHSNINHIEMKIQDNYTIADLNYFSTQTSPLFSLELLLNWIAETCRQLLDVPRIKLFFEENKRKNKPFDLIILDGACCESFLGFIEAFGSPPLVVATAFASSSYILEYAGLYDNPAYVPFSSSPFTSKMNFVERLQNSLFYLYYYYRYHKEHLDDQNKIARSFFGNGVGDVRDLSRRAVVTLINQHPVFDGVKPYLPNTITIGGFNINPAKPLDKELQTFIDKATHGVVYFSFGSNLQCQYMTEEKFNIFLQAFKEIKQHVVWKCDKKITNLPKNVYLGKWFKQSDILGQPKVKVFISHGGLLGTQEAIYNGVPILVFPFLIDQHFIAARLRKMGVSITMSYADVTVNSLKQALNELLTDKSYKEKMEERSAAFRDNPISPKDLTIYWIEYALRHPQGELLRSQTQKMPIYQILLLDVIAFILAFITIIMIICIFLIVKLKSKIFKISKNKLKIS